jgi:hypothetical protein
MMDQIEESDFVLIVCTEKYNLRYRNKEEHGHGRGVTWEGGLIIAELYSGQGINDKFIPVLLSPEGENHIPRSLQAYTIYRLWSNDDYDINKQGDYQNLYRHLTKQPEVVPAQLGKPQTLFPAVRASSTVGDQGEIIQDENLVVAEEQAEWKQTQLEQQQKASNYDDLSSDRGINYTQLQYLLQSGQWQAADQETTARMCEVMGRQNEGWLRSSNIKQFPSTDLRTIDHLWVKYSDGKFGFSVQKKIWQQCNHPARWKWEMFAEEVGWKSETLWKTFTHNELALFKNAPKGYLPFKIFVAPVFLTLTPKANVAPNKNIPLWKIKEFLREEAERYIGDIREAWRAIAGLEIAFNCKNIVEEIMNSLLSRNDL